MGSNREWVAWGEKDPLYGVATFEEERKRGGASEWTDDDVYSMGLSDWQHCLKRWRSYGLTEGRCVEIGCGVGRYTNALATTFQHVDGIDVSPGMIEYARKRVDRSNVIFTLADGESIPLEGDSVDAVYSSFVFQHFDTPAKGYSYFRDMARVLKEGGTIMVHVPLHQFPIFSYRLGKIFSGVYDLVQRLRRVQFRLKAMRNSVDGRPLQFRLLSYDTDLVFRELELLGFTDLEVAIFELPSRRERLHFLFARKRLA